MTGNDRLNVLRMRALLAAIQDGNHEVVARLLKVVVVPSDKAA